MILRDVPEVIIEEMSDGVYLHCKVTIKTGPEITDATPAYIVEPAHVSREPSKESFWFLLRQAGYRVGRRHRHCRGW